METRYKKKFRKNKLKEDYYDELNKNIYKMIDNDFVEDDGDVIKMGVGIALDLINSLNNMIDLHYKKYSPAYKGKLKTLKNSVKMAIISESKAYLK